MAKTEDKRFKDFYNTYFRYVYKIVRSHIANTEDASDIISEVFVNIWHSFENLDFNSNIKSYVFTVTKRRVLDFLRKKYRFSNKELSLSDELIDSLSSSNEDSIQNTENLLIQTLVAKLNTKDQLFYNKKYKENKTYIQIAKELNISVGNAKVINNRLVKKLKTIWIQTLNQN